MLLAFDRLGSRVQPEAALLHPVVMPTQSINMKIPSFINRVLLSHSLS